VTEDDRQLREGLPLLWHFAISHFTEKARWALDFKRIPHREQTLFLDYPIRVPLRTGQSRLPVLFWDDETVCDSTRIISFLEEQRPDPSLYPRDPAELQRALALEDFFDEELGPHVRAVVVRSLFEAGAEVTADCFGMGQPEHRKRMLRLAFPVFRFFYERRHDMLGDRIELGHRKVQEAVSRLCREIGASGYLVGERFSVADLCAASLFYPIALPEQYPYTPPAAMREISRDLFRGAEFDIAREWVTRIYAAHRAESSAR
jgi:glutathione S-transferase